MLKENITKKLKKKRKGRIEKQRGITLIALVITIIVLLILAGVSIATLTGENGILTKANKAKEETEKASEEEQRELAMIEATMNTENTTFQGVTIPAGFAPTRIEGESTVDEGLVITDSEGNEFVWIPCTEAEYRKEPDQNWFCTDGYKNNKPYTDVQANTIGLQSVTNNKGFYVGRYEAGISDKAVFYPNEKNHYKYYTSEDDMVKDTAEYKPVSKKGVPVWTFISQENAKESAEKMVDSNDTSVSSYLIDSYAWNTICRIFEKKGKDISSTSWGNFYDTKVKYEELDTLFALHTYSSNKWTYASQYSKGKIVNAPKGEGINRIELSAGASESFKAYNIYDMAGNVWEWLTEETENRAVRRGSCSHDNIGGVVTLDSCPKDHAAVLGGFRVVLYFK